MDILDKYKCPQCHSTERRRYVQGYESYVRYECMCGAVSYHMGARISGDKILPPQVYTNWHDVVRVMAYTEPADVDGKKGQA